MVLTISRGLDDTNAADDGTGILRPHDLTCLKPHSRHQADGSHYDEQVYCGKIGEEGRQNSPCAVVRGNSKQARTMRNGLMLAACLLSRTRVTSGPELLPSATSGSASYHSGVCIDVHGPLCHQKSHRCLGSRLHPMAMLIY